MKSVNLVENFIQNLKESEPDKLAYLVSIPARRGKCLPLPSLHPQLAQALQKIGVRRLYQHQYQALELVQEGHNVIVASGTASGKSLCYHLPVVENLLNDSQACSFYLFPTKALAQDQLRFLDSLKLNIVTGTYDADTPSSEKRYLRENAQLLLTNPDMLHHGILPHHQRFGRFFLNLKFVVIDEAHVLRGIFGSNTGLVLRRLLRLSAHYQSEPQFILASATIANPKKAAENLTGLPFKEVREDTSPSGKRWFIFWNPPFILGQEKRRSSNWETTELLVKAVQSGVKTIVFSKSKQNAELIFKYAQERLKEMPSLTQALAVYRAGYLPQERRQIEKKLFAGELKGVSATSALELGIDIGNLDASILNGYPGTISSTWQQAGRAGRKTQKCVSILVAQEDPLNQYFMNHPQDFFKRPHEAAIVDVENPYLLFQHLLCAAYELPLTQKDQHFFGHQLTNVLDKLVSLGFLKKKGNKWYLQKKTYPAKEVNLRSSSQESFSIVEAETGCLLGILDENTAFLYVHPGAVYLHQGESYLVLELNLDKKVAVVKQENLPYFTQPREESSLEILEIKEKGVLAQVQAWLGEVEVTTHVTAFQKKAISTGQAIGKEYLDLPPQRFRTEAAWFTVPEAIIEKLQLNQQQLAGGLHAIEHGAIALLPLIALCDRWDVGGVSTPAHHQTDEASVFIYDAYQGGVGIARRCFNQINTHLNQTYHLIKDCPCKQGCPSCIQSPKCGNWNDPLDKEVAIFILQELLTC